MKGGNLKTARLAAGLSQQALAEKADCSIHTVRVYERGYVPHESEVLGRIWAVLELAEPTPPEEAVA